MGNVRGFEIPENLYYDVKNHVWVKIVNGEALVGLDDVGQFLARRIVFVRPKPPGSHVKKGDPLVMIESVKWVGVLPSPLTGTVAGVNQEVMRKPLLVNQKPYESWIVKLKPEKIEEELKSLVTGQKALEEQEKDMDRRGIKSKGA